MRLGDLRINAFRQARHQLFRNLSAESVACGHGPELRVGYPTGVEGKMDWRYEGVSDIHEYHYRTVLPNQLVFDIGDDLAPGVPRPWPETVADTHALWTTLNMLRVPYWGSLSGGKGTHTELFGPVDLKQDQNDDKDERWGIARYILMVAWKVRRNGLWGDGIVHDPLLISPNPGSRMLREFGAPKSPGATRAKVLWTIGPSPYLPLPVDRDLAYNQAERSGLTMPSLVPRDENLRRLLVHHRSPGPCPRGPQCYPGPPGIWGVCQHCSHQD